MLRRVAFDDPAAARLSAAMEAEMVVRYGDGGAIPVAAQDFSGEHAVFLVAAVDGRDVGCGGVRPLADGIGEIKRMYVDPVARGRGVGRAVLRGLLTHGREVGLVRLQLETGTAQPEAMALYAAAGFTSIRAYGHYADDPRQRCFALELR